MTECITHEEQDETAWVCRCSNTPSGSGFTPCDSKGNLVEPTVESGWSHLYRCLQCSILIDQRDLSIVDKQLNEVELVWRGITIHVRYDTRYYGDPDLHHLDIEAVEPPRARLPITGTGYLSHFFHGEGLTDVAAAVRAWLDEEAEEPEWKAHESSTRQLSLF